MKRSEPATRESGFALIVTLLLLALLVLAVYALGTLVRVDGEVATMAVYRTQARQNALLGLALGVAKLQREAGLDTRITGMAGMAGAGPGATGAMRHWCGVWRDDGSFVTWLVSGAEPGAAPAIAGEGIELVAGGSVGAVAIDAEHVIAGKIPIVVAESAATPGVAARIGNVAYLVSDEGVKISAFVPDDERAPSGGRVAIPNEPGALAELRAAVEAHGSALPRVISFEQLSLLGTPPAEAHLPWSALRKSFHHVTRTARTIAPAGNGYVAGTVNLNTTSTVVWRGILEGYNAGADEDALIPASDMETLAEAMAEGLAAAGGPFRSVEAWGESALLSDVLPPPVTPERFMAVVGPLLRVRSDTFRVRAYGEAVNPVDGANVEAVAYCEALVQRTPDPAADGTGRKFVVIFFRWLGPTDV